MRLLRYLTDSRLKAEARFFSSPLQLQPDRQLRVLSGGYRSSLQVKWPEERVQLHACLCISILVYEEVNYEKQQLYFTFELYKRNPRRSYMRPTLNKNISTSIPIFWPRVNE
jgi:hypothetical protein